MPLPAGFKVNGSKTKNSSSVPIPPRVANIIKMLDKLPHGHLFTSMDLEARLGVYGIGTEARHLALYGYREKVDNKLYWGNRKSIAQLRKQLTQSEESNG